MFLLLPNDFLSWLQGNSIIGSFFIIKNGVVWHLQHVHKPAIKCKEALLRGHFDSHSYIIKYCCRNTNFFLFWWGLTCDTVFTVYALRGTLFSSYSCTCDLDLAIYPQNAKMHLKGKISKYKYLKIFFKILLFCSNYIDPNCLLMSYQGKHLYYTFFSYSNKGRGGGI